jgi:hypothetical protein
MTSGMGRRVALVKNRRFGGTYSTDHQDRISKPGTELAVTSYYIVVLNSLIIFPLMMKVINSSEASVLNTRHPASHHRRRHFS